MTTDEKKLLQAKHRLEEAEMRDRQKERQEQDHRADQHAGGLRYSGDRKDGHTRHRERAKHHI